MAASTTVTVLTPNGRRQTVKVSPNTPLLQVLEDVCKKHGFNSDDHGLKFQRNVLDLSLQWRFASVPNNAKLEMVPSTRKQTGADSSLRIALQLEDGSRLQGSFSSGQTLWEVLTHFPQIRVSELPESGPTPVCVYMRDEVSGENALKKATLKSLGLTGGSAIVRFLQRKTKLPGDGENDTARTAAAETVPCPLPSLDPPPSRTEREAVAPSVEKESPDRPMEVAAGHASAPEAAAGTFPAIQEADSFPKSQAAVRPKSVPLVGEKEGEWKGEEDGEKAGPSGQCSPNPSTSSSSPPSAPFIPFSGGGQRLGGPGASGAGPSASSVPSVAGGPPKAKKAKPDNAKRQDSAKTDDWTMGEELLEPMDREPLVYHMDSGARRTGDDQDLPDEFFEVTVDDIRKRFAQLKSERRVLEEAPLMTKALREYQMKEKMDRYPRVVLRVQFPDRRVLQGFFRPLETVAALRYFVKSHLQNPESPFYLFIAPPKTMLDDPTATLFQANLFPAALVYFGSDVKTECYLRKDLLGSSVSALEADEVIAGCMPRSSPPSSSSMVTEETLQDPPESPRGGEEDDEESTTQGQAPKPIRTDPGKVPKWLKLPGFATFLLYSTTHVSGTLSPF
ncbi:tether containing UBX domain for GLUT4 isoform X2 [Esox lucius]|uniref:tether containing UBX domain for GLUT4 isoform X2 n=1 Tax=Esox lucius TaxID=8010 RepID=UPI0014770F2E|nr:tether containing UBX domain for GLUT4 isoform X2 [Esox lucius]